LLSLCCCCITDRDVPLNNKNMTENGNATELGERWTADELMGKGSLGDHPSSPSTTAERRKLSFRIHKHQDKVDPADWGRPGHLTQEEVDVYVSGIASSRVLLFRR
jgi:hypothetical protein